MSKVVVYVELMGAIRKGLRLVLTPKHRFGEPVASIVLLEHIRAIGTIAITIAIGLLYRPVNLGTVNGAMDGIMTDALLALPAVAIGMVVMLVLSSKRSRRDMLKSLTTPTLTILSVIAVACIIQFVVQPVFSSTFRMASVPVSIIGIALLIGAAVIGIPAILYALYLCSRNWFNAADAHPLLPSLASIIFAILLLGYNIYLTVAVGLDSYIPAPVAFLVTFGGPPTMIAVAVVEMRRSRECGITLRELPAAQSR